MPELSPEGRHPALRGAADGRVGQFPQYRGREGEIGTLEERINGCLERA